MLNQLKTQIYYLCVFLEDEDLFLCHVEQVSDFVELPFQFVGVVEDQVLEFVELGFVISAGCFQHLEELLCKLHEVNFILRSRCRLNSG